MGEEYVVWHGGGWVAAEHHGYSSIQCEPLALLGGEQCTAAVTLTYTMGLWPALTHSSAPSEAPSPSPSHSHCLTISNSNSTPSPSPSPQGLARAVRVVDAVSVVLLTEQLSSSGLALLRHSLGLPASAFGEPTLRLINCFKPVVGAATREALQDHPAVRLDTALYEHARRRYQALFY